MIFIIKKFINTLLVISNFSPLALVWILKAFTVDWIVRAWSFSQLPALARSMGLKHKKPEELKGFGTLHGSVKGHVVIVTPENHMNSKVQIDLRHAYQGLDISLDKPYLRCDKKVRDFTTPDRQFNRTFKTRRIHKDAVTHISENRKLISLLNRFYTKWIFKLENLIISRNDIICTLKYGFNFFPYIPAWKFRSLVLELTALAEQIDSLLANSPAKE